MMKRFLTSALILSAISGFGLVGCGEETKTESTTTTTTPGGTDTKQITVKEKTTGDGAAGVPGGTTTPAPVK
jgi:hypothetical protein